VTVSIRKLLFGNPLATEALAHERLTKTQALAVFSSDALSSVAYATEEILLVLVTISTATFVFSIPIAVTICALLAVVTASYWQTIHAYPSGGGAFIVALDNMGEWWGLIAGASLLIDYVLTVAVSVSAGVRAITSAIPELLPFTVLLCILSILVVMWINLRGIRESAGVFAIPTYAFIGLTLLLVAVGVFGMATGRLHALPDIQAAHRAAVAGTHSLGLLILLRAFSSGCTAMTGVEAVSNGVPAFKEPSPRNAGITLMAMSILLAVMFIGITVLAFHLDAIPREEESVVSQVARTVFGHGALYYAFQAATALILMLAANTSFAGFPMLASVLARSDYLPRQLANLGDRLAFTNGIVALAGLAIVLIVVFEGSTDALVPLYAVGVFTGFSLSQAGMVIRWMRLQSAGWGWKATINGVGCICTAIALMVIIESKFSEGAWLIVVLVPVLLFVFRKVKRHYERVSRELSPRLGGIGQFMRKLSATEPKVVVPISKLHRGTLAALNHARSLSRDVTAVVVDLDPRGTAELALAWKALRFHEPLVTLSSPYRSIVAPLMSFLEQVDAREPERGPAIVVLPLFVPSKWWHHLLHNQTGIMLKAALLYRRGPGGSDTRIVVDVPYHLKD
jgi:amino acid transporter